MTDPKSNLCRGLQECSFFILVLLLKCSSPRGHSLCTNVVVPPTNYAMDSKSKNSDITSGPGLIAAHTFL